MFECFRGPMKETLCRKIHRAMEAMEASGPEANLETRQDLHSRQVHIHSSLFVVC